MRIRFKKIKFSIVLCLVTLSFYKILIDELFTSDNIFFKIAKIISITIGLLVVTLIIYGIYLQKSFDNKYIKNKRIYFGNKYWKLTSIIIVYFLVALYYFGMPLRIWYLIFIIPYASILLYGLRSTYILLDCNNKLYLVNKDYSINVVNNISYDKSNDILSIEITNKLNMIEKVIINKMKNKKTIKEIYYLSEKYNVLITE